MDFDVRQYNQGRIIRAIGIILVIVICLAVCTKVSRSDVVFWVCVGLGIGTVVVGAYLTMVMGRIVRISAHIIGIEIEWYNGSTCQMAWASIKAMKIQDGIIPWGRRVIEFYGDDFDAPAMTIPLRAIPPKDRQELLTLVNFEATRRNIEVKTIIPDPI